MLLRPALFLQTAAGSLTPSGGGGSSTAAADAAAAAAAAAADDSNKKGDSDADKLRKEWKGKTYAQIAAHHVALTHQGRTEEAAEFHSAVVKTFRDKK